MALSNLIHKCGDHRNRTRCGRRILGDKTPRVATHDAGRVTCSQCLRPGKRAAAVVAASELRCGDTIHHGGRDVVLATVAHRGLFSCVTFVGGEHVFLASTDVRRAS